jgi:secreted PhoX family phosphatase
MSKSTTDTTVRNSSANEPFSRILELRVSRRFAIRSGFLAAFTTTAASALSGCNSDDDTLPPTTGAQENAPSAEKIMDRDPVSPPAKLQLGFESLPGSMTDACVVPEGYIANLLAPWGTPLNGDALAWDKDGLNTSQDLLNSTGMHHDGIHFFPLEGSSNEGLLAINHEYIDPDALHPDGSTEVDGKRPAEEVRKEINAHGVSVVHIRKQAGHWNIVPSSRYNRRFTSATPMDLTGPIRGSDWVKTPYSPAGTAVRGTNNNCGNGSTPWGTYITAEENWAGSFVNRSAQLPVHQRRVGVSSRASRYKWETASNDATETQGEFARFDVTPTASDAMQDWRNEVNGFGYLVEIDPYAPESVAQKRTALGRFAHESFSHGKLEAGKPIAFYSGDDSRFEYVYRFVSEALWDPKDADRTDRLEVGAKYMDRGTLYAARFGADGTGEWLPLTVDSLNAQGVRLGDQLPTQAHIIIHTRLAADFMGATPMDRPEWTATHPHNGDVYVTLTNNSRRDEKSGTNPANPRLNNVNGHIVRWNDDSNSNNFKWDIFVFGSNAAAHAQVNQSGLTALNQFASPDGLAFDDRGILWIQTDNGDNVVADATNDQMLVVIPTALADSEGIGPWISPANQNELRRFFIGPNGCEVTGFAFTPDHTTIFVNIQHPDNWPAYDSTDATLTPHGNVRPRSSTVAIQRIDGGPVGV